MPLFDDLKNKALRTAQAAADKTKVVMETAKLNGQIDDEKKSINFNFTRIGEICYENYPDGITAASIAELVNQINESKTKITELEKQVRALKGMTKCDKCGAEVQEDKAFCGTCGASVLIETKDTSEEGVSCSKCSSVLPLGSLFCTSCGQKVDSQEG